MKRNEIKERAMKFCQDNNIDSYPVEIVKICNEQGLKVFEEYLKPDESGLIVVDNKKWDKYDSDKFIVVNSYESATRRRFTIAHELAHFVLHKGENVLYAHRDMTDNRGDNAEIEREANYIAANVLMPEELVINRVEEIRRNAAGSTPSFLLAKLIADDFYVSESAAEVRLKQLGII